MAQLHTLHRHRRYLLGDYPGSGAPLFSPVSVWRGQNDLTDWTGLQNLTAQGTVNFTTGLVGRAFSFTNTNWAYATYNYPSLGSVAGMTLCCWFNTTTALGGGFCSVQTTQTTTSGTRDYPLFMQNNGTVGFGFFAGSQQLAISSSSYNNGAWHFIAGTLLNSATGGVLYVDGSQVATKAVSGGIANWVYTPTYFRIGNGDFASAWGYTATNVGVVCSMQDFRFYNVALTSTQIAQLYAAGPF